MKSLIKLNSNIYIISNIDVIFFCIILFWLNLQLFLGNFESDFVFFPANVQKGEWWRVITHPFVHVSWYHFLLDAGAFIILYSGLVDNNFIKRISYLIASGLFGLVFTLLLEPDVYSIGLCGLSGIAHGLMAVTGLEMIRKNFKAGMICFSIVLLKSIIEVLRHVVFFSSVHLNLCGNPLPVCHLGGVIGGTIVFLFFKSVPVIRTNK